MRKRLNLSYLVFIFLFGLLINLTIPFLNPAQAADDGTYGLNTTAASVNAFSGAASQGDAYYNTFFQSKIGQIVGLVLSFIGVAFLILMIYAGITWMTAQGNDQTISKAKDLIVSSIIGLIIVLAAYAITSFIGAQILQ